MPARQLMQGLGFIGRKTNTIRPLLLKVGFLLAFLYPFGVPAQTPGQSGNTELRIKAAYIYKFASYVEWPNGAFAAPDSPLVIGVIGADALSGELEHTIIGHTVNGRPLAVRKLKRGNPLTGLHILFIGDVRKEQLQEMLHELKNQPLLTVTASEETHALGSMINFVVIGERVRFEVALAPIGAAGLKISARMLTAAYRVTPGISPPHSIQEAMDFPIASTTLPR